MEELERHERTGRPLGDDRFIELAEKLLSPAMSNVRRRFQPANQTFELNYPGGGQSCLSATGITPLNPCR
jgi:hypothetical protein